MPRHIVALPQRSRSNACISFGKPPAGQTTFAFGTGTSLAVEPVNHDRAGVAIEGYDPVAYHTEGRPVKGDAAITRTWNGAVWRFADARNRDAFAADPERYAPAYGGYCAYGLAVAGKRFDVAIDTWQIVDGRLMLNKSAGVREKFDADRAEMIVKADANWASLMASEDM